MTITCSCGKVIKIRDSDAREYLEHIRKEKEKAKDAARRAKK